MLKNSLDSYCISTRVRLARNFAGRKFVPAVGYNEAREIADAASAALETQGFLANRLGDLDSLAAGALQERHLISNALVRNADIAAVALREQTGESVMINEEDHMRLQCILDGFEPDEAYRRVSLTDDKVAMSLAYAYDDRLGYLTACPTNLGTGMRASVMMFLPGLNLTGGISELAASGAIGNLTFRGVYGEGTEAEGFLYQLSNRSTLGLSEMEILQEVKKAVNFIAETEDRARDRLYAENRVTLTDRIMRGWGLLTNSYTMAVDECEGHLAFVKLGVGLGLVQMRDPRLLDRLTVDCRPACLACGVERSEEELGVERAAKLRGSLNGQRLA